MRNVSSLSYLLVLLLSACSMFGSDSSEKVHSAYMGTGSMDQQQIGRLLTEQGYTDITGLHKNGADWVGSAINRDGQTVNFDIDKTGNVRTK